MVGSAGFDPNQPALMPQEFPLLPVVDGWRLLPHNALGYVVVFAIADVLAPELPNVACPAVTPVPGRDEALKGPLFVDVLAA